MKLYIRSNTRVPCSKRRFTIKASDDSEFDLNYADQQFSSAKTAVNGKQGKLPAVFKAPGVSFKSGSINLDYGGGTEDATAVADAYFEKFNATNLIYDRYNQTAEHNREVVKICRQNGGADTATCCNVLNVIAEESSRLNVLENISQLVKPGGTIWIYVHEGSKKDQESGGRQTGKDQYQNYRKTDSYLEEIRQVFPDAIRKGKLVTCHNNSVAASSHINDNLIFV